GAGKSTQLGRANEKEEGNQHLRAGRVGVSKFTSSGQLSSMIRCANSLSSAAPACTSAVHSATRSTTSPAPTVCRGRYEPPALGRAPRRKDDKPKLQRGMAHPVCRGARTAPAARPLICF